LAACPCLLAVTSVFRTFSTQSSHESATCTQERAHRARGKKTELRGRELQFAPFERRDGRFPNSKEREPAPASSPSPAYFAPSQPNHPMNLPPVPKNGPMARPSEGGLLLPSREGEKDRTAGARTAVCTVRATGWSVSKLHRHQRISHLLNPIIP
jgi:hypothetical protein